MYLHRHAHAILHWPYDYVLFADAISQKINPLKSLITARDENFLTVYRQSLDTSIEEHVPSKKMRPREELRQGL